VAESSEVRLVIASSPLGVLGDTKIIREPIEKARAQLAIFRASLALSFSNYGQPPEFTWF
jgi:hypothetical protein